MVAPTRWDMKCVDKAERYKVASPGGGIRMIKQQTHLIYFDGEESFTLAAILFPDGTEWYMQ